MGRLPEGKLIAIYSLTEKQAEAILQMRLQRLTGLERDKIEAEYQGITQTIAYLTSILEDESRDLLGIIKEELLELKRKYQDERRTDIRGRGGRPGD